MNYKIALKKFSEGQGKAVYICYGTEQYLINEFIQGLIDQVIEPDHIEFAVSKYDLKETNIADVIEDVETLPFMVPKKVVIAEGAYFFTAAKENSKQAKIDHQIERLMEYLKSPVDYTILVLTVSEEKLDERKKIVKTVKELAGVIPCVTLTPQDLNVWISMQAQKFNMTMDHEAIEKLVLNVGADLQKLNSELEKLSLYVGNEGEVTSALVDQMVVRSAEQHVFQLIDEVVQMNLQQALQILDDLLKNREEPIKILMLIVRQFRIILQAKDCLQRGYTQQQIASLLKLHPFVVKKALDQGRKYTQIQLMNIISQLAQLDVQMKTGRIEKVLGLELFLLRLAVKKVQ